MKLTSEGKKSVTVGASGMTVQGINLENTKAVISILRDKIYTDKPKAALTETLCNAIDEHRKYKVKRPVDLIITQQNVIIRDYAKGLDEEGVTKVFFQYMNSTKSDNNFDIGGYGIGAKSPSSYTSVWYVKSFFGGKKTTYMSVIDNEEGKTYKMLEQDCDPNDTGICVVIPLEGDNIYSKSHQADNFMSIACDLITMLGYDKDELEVKGYFVPDASYAVQDDEEFFKLNDEVKETLHTYFNNRRKFKYRIKDFAEGNVPDSDYTYVAVPGEAIVLRGNNYHNRNIFHSNFFSSSRFIAYDGDVCYNVRLSKAIIDKYCLQHTSSTIILFFKRGEVSIAPTREDISMSNSANALFESKLELLDKEFKRRFKEAFNEAIAKDQTLGKAMYAVTALCNIDFSTYYRSNNVSSMLPEYSNLAGLFHNKGIVPHASRRYGSSTSQTKLITYANNVAGVFSCTVEVNTGKIITSSSKRYSTWNGYDISMSDEVVFLTLNTSNKYKKFYKAEMVAGLVATYKDAIKKRYEAAHPSSLNLSGMSPHYSFNVVFINEESLLMDYFKSANLTDKELKLFRKGIDIVNIDDIAANIPARVINRVPSTKATTGKKVKSERVLRHILNDMIVYKEEDVKDKKVLIIPATELIQDNCRWKHVKNALSRKGSIYMTAFEWLTGYDIVAKVYKEDIPFWTKKGATLAGLDNKFIEDIIREGVRNHKIIYTPSLYSEYKFLDPNNTYDKKFGGYINLSRGSVFTVNDKNGNPYSFDMHDLYCMVDNLSSSILAEIKDKSTTAIKYAVNTLTNEERKSIITAIYKQALGMPGYIGMQAENCGFMDNYDFCKEVHAIMTSDRDEATKLAVPAFEKFINNIVIKLI